MTSLQAASTRESTRADEQLFDLHTHSRYSDGLSGLPEIEAHCLQTGIGVALTDHNEIRGSIRLCERGQIPCIPGIEVGTAEGLEFLVYFESPDRLEDYFTRAVEPFLLRRFMVRSNVAVLDCLDMARELGAFVSLAHPFAFGRKSLDYQREKQQHRPHFIDEVLDRVDAIEYFNGGVPPRVNQRAAEFIPSTGKPVTVGSDSHRVNSFGSCGLFLDTRGRRETAGLFEALKAGAMHEQHRMRHSHVAVTLPIIMLNHTLFFLRKGNHPARKEQQHARHRRREDRHGRR